MKTIHERRKEAAELRERIARLSRVSPDSASREAYNLQALERAIRAEEEDKIFFSSEGKGVLVLNISALQAEKSAEFIAACGGWKSHTNSALLVLDGERGEIRRNAAGTCWVIDLASHRRTVMFAWASGPGQVRFGGPRLNTTNGAAHWCGVVSAATPLDPERNAKTIAWLQAAMAGLAEHGRTPRQHDAFRAAAHAARCLRASAIERAGVDAAQALGITDCRSVIALATEIVGDGPMPANLVDIVVDQIRARRQAAEEARIMAELEAEQAKLADEKAALAAAEKQRQAIAATCSALGVTPEQWQGWSAKQQRLAMHKARLAGKL